MTPAMGSLVAAVGALWIAVIMWDAFEAIVLPRRLPRPPVPARPVVLHSRSRRRDADVPRGPRGNGDRGGRGVRLPGPRDRISAGPVPVVLAAGGEHHAARRARGVAAERRGAAARLRRRPRGADGVARGMGTLGRRGARVAPVLSRAVLLSLAARQPVVAC